MVFIFVMVSLACLRLKNCQRLLKIISKKTKVMSVHYQIRLEMGCPFLSDLTGLLSSGHNRSPSYVYILLYSYNSHFEFQMDH